MNDDDPKGEGFPGDIGLSVRVLTLYRRAKQAQSRKERACVMLALALAFTEEHDFTDFTATDDWHAYIEDFEKDRLRYERSALRLARLVCNTLDEFYEGDEEGVSDLGMGTSSKLIN